MPEPPTEARFTTETATLKTLRAYFAELDGAVTELGELWEASGEGAGTTRAAVAAPLRRIAGRAELIEVSLLWLEHLRAEKDFS